MALTANSNFYFKMKSLNFQTWRRFRREDLEGKIHFEHFPSLSFGPSQCHNSVNIGSNSTSRDSFVICRSRALIWHQDWWYFWWIVGEISSWSFGRGYTLPTVETTKIHFSHLNLYKYYYFKPLLINTFAMNCFHCCQKKKVKIINATLKCWNWNIMKPR